MFLRVVSHVPLTVLVWESVIIVLSHVAVKQRSDN
jgi:hypothetical protein